MRHPPRQNPYARPWNLPILPESIATRQSGLFPITGDHWAAHARSGLAPQTEAALPVGQHRQHQAPRHGRKDGYGHERGAAAEAFGHRTGRAARPSIVVGQSDENDRQCGKTNCQSDRGNTEGTHDRNSKNYRETLQWNLERNLSQILLRMRLFPVWNWQRKWPAARPGWAGSLSWSAPLWPPPPATRIIARRTDSPRAMTSWNRRGRWGGLNFFLRDAAAALQAAPSAGLRRLLRRRKSQAHGRKPDSGIRPSAQVARLARPVDSPRDSRGT